MTKEQILALAESISKMTNEYDIAIELTELYYKGKTDAHNDMFKTTGAK